MSISDLIEQVRSGVVRIEHILNEKIAASGSGFLAAGYLITNNHVFVGPANAQVRISTGHDGSTTQSVELSYDSWRASLVSGSPEQDQDFAVLRVPGLHDLYEFEMEAPVNVRAGDSVAILGYPFGSAALVCHLGIISSRYERKGVNILQLDASVNVSNSGGPLVDVRTGKVIGIVTRKAHGFSEQIEQLKSLAKVNQSAIDKLPLGPKPVTGISMGHMAKEGVEAQLKLLTEIERSANVGIGYAFSIEHLLNDSAFFN